VNLDILDLARSADNRRCGECTLCCTLLPVKSLSKGANTRCAHARGLGCNIYRKEGFPSECALWNCRWLINDDAGDLQRPDRCHYVIDIVPDFVTTGDTRAIKIPIVQVWCDPRYPDAHRDPALRAWIIRQTGFAALIRYNDRDALFLLPPYMSDTNEWEEIGGNRTNMEEGTHRADQIAAALHESGIGVEVVQKKRLL
jgi:hypothetical protein